MHKFLNVQKSLKNQGCMILVALFLVIGHSVHGEIGPIVPVDFKVLYAGHNSVRLVWGYSGESVDNFVIERKVNTGSFSQLTTVGGSVNSFTNTGLVVGNTYVYRIKSKKGTTTSATTNEVSLRIPANKDFIPSELQMSPGDRAPFVPIEQALVWSDLSVNNTYDVFQTPPCLSGEYYVGFELSYDLGDFDTETSWTADLQIRLMNGSTVLWTKPLSLNAASATWTGTVFHDVALSCSSSYQFKIQSKSSTGTVPQGRITLKEKLFKKVGDTFNPAQTPTLGVTYSGGNSTLSWTAPNADFSEYDLEWVFISSYDGFTGSTAASAFSYGEAVRIRLQGNSYVHKVFYPQGKLYYRVRSVGYHPDYPERKLLGNWSYGPNGGTSISNPVPGLNWQMRTDYIEGGRYKKTVTYLDGSLRNRQTVSTLDGGSDVLVGETMYDFEGREAVQFLPAPVVATSLNYKNGFNRFNTSVVQIQGAVNTSYSTTGKRKYHYDNGRVTNNTASSGYGTGKYYSTNNNFTGTVNRSYIPNAGGYGIVTSEYSHDGTGRVTRQGQPGSRLRIDGTNSTRTYYSQVYPEELIRLFGSNAGEAVHYRKEVVVDPNNQATVQYLNQEGLVVASFMSGVAPPNLVTPLGEYLDRQNSGWPTNSYDLSSQNKRDDEGFLVDAAFVNMTANTPYTLDYSLSGMGSDLNEAGCQSCEFTLTLSLVDPDGELVSLPTVSGDENGELGIFQKTMTATDCQVETNFSAISLSLTLDKIGEYRVVKRLKVKEKTVDELLTEIRSNSVFQQQKQVVEANTGQEVGDCALCMEECSEADEALQAAYPSLADAEIFSAYSAIYQDILAENPDLDPRDSLTVEGLVNSHPDYCYYDLLRENRAARIFELELMGISGYSEALSQGKIPLPESDPFYNGGMGTSKKGTLTGKLNSIKLNAQISGSLDQLTDPGTVFMRVDSTYSQNAGGYHMLYYDLHRDLANNEITVQQFNEQVDELRWSLYVSFYLRFSDEVKNEIQELQSCPKYLETTLSGLGMPTTYSEYEDYIQQEGALDPVSEAELDQLVHWVTNSGSCQVIFTPAEETTIRESLRDYLDSNREGNIFNLILEEDINDPLLAPLKNLLTSKSCSINDYTTPNPLICKSEIIRTIPIIPESDDCQVNNRVMASDVNNSGKPELQKLPLNESGQLSELLNERLEDELENKLKIPIESKDNSSNRRINGIESSTIVYPKPSPEEYQALMDLYQATGGDNWINNSGWSTADPNVVENVGDWYGISVNEFGNVVTLQLHYNNLVGTIPSSIQNIESLRFLWLFSNELSGPIPDVFHQLSSLEHLHLADNQLTGGIPSHLGLSPSLQEIYLSKNQLTGTLPSNLGNITPLRWLVLYDNEFSGTIPKEFGNLANLEYLYLYRNILTGSLPSTLGNLSKLKFLGVHGNSISGVIPNSFGNLSNLEELYLNDNQIGGVIPSGIGGLTKLNNIWMSNNQLKGSIPSSFGNLNLVHTLYLMQNELSGPIPPELGDMTSLQYFRLSENKLQGEIPTQLGNLYNVIDFMLDVNELTGQVPPSICNLPNLVRFRAHTNMLEGDIPQCLLNKGLNDIWFSYNKYSFQDLQGKTQYFPYQSNYSPQRTTTQDTVITIMGSGGFSLVSDLGKDLASPTSYQWHKNGVGINWPTPAYDSLYMDCPEPTFGNCFDCEGVYQVYASNPDYPGVYLLGEKINVEAYKTEVQTLCTSFELDPTFNPWLNSVTYSLDWEEVLERCIAERDTVRAAVQKLAVEKLEDTWLESYYSSQSTSCLEGVEESLTMEMESREYHYTLYYYDQSGNLVQTVPPKGVKPLTESQVSQVKSGTNLLPSHELLTKYRYNSKDQLVWQSSPDGGVSEFWYNSVGQLRLSQNAKQAALNAYSYSKYDRLGRVIETGEMVTTEALSSLKGKLYTLDFPQRASYTCQDITLTGYDRPKSGLHQKFGQEHLRNRVSWTAQLEKGKTDTLLTAYSYDANGNVERLLQQIPGLAPKVMAYQYDRISGNVNYVYYQPGTAEQLIHHYRYDADNRLEEVQTSTDGYLWSTDATYYYYPHGPLARVELGEHKVQGLDYYYTLQGWLKGVNMPGGGDPGADGQSGKRTGTDAMAFALGYFNGDYSPITSGTVLTDSRDALWSRTSTLNTNTGLYNGNITWMNTELAGSQDQYDMQAMVYKYDQLNRVVQARSLRAYTTSFTSRSASSTGAYDATYTYDGNGNLLTLQRRNSSASLQDNFSYGYYANSNKLRQTSSSQGDNYTYDAIGNLTKDVSAGVTNIEWTPSGKVRKVTKSSGSPVEFRYDAAGNRVEKKQGTTITRYIRDASGNVMAVYQADTLSERPIYGSSRLGNMAYASQPGYRTVGYKQYELSNHLGNVLAVVSDRIHMSTDSTWTDVLSRSDYYPFGLEMSGRTEINGYRYGFQGQENEQNGEFGDDHNSFKFRIYNPSIGKFLSIDPLSGKYPYYSPYSFSGNRVIDMIELEGAEPTQPKYMWTPTNVTGYGHGTRMKVEDWWVFSSVDNMGYEVHQYWDPNRGVWKSFSPSIPEPDAPTVSRIAYTSVAFAAGGVSGGVLAETGIAGWLLRESIEGLLEEISGIPYIPINPDFTDIADPAINRAVKEIFEGGQYGKLPRKKDSGFENHHLPADAVSPLSTYKGGAIQIDPIDHKLTGSYGSSRAAKQYRAAQQRLIDAGDFKGAFEMDVKDLRSKFGNKYNEAIEDSRQYYIKEGIIKE